jgi:signal transduction histidine kinase
MLPTATLLTDAAQLADRYRTALDHVPGAVLIYEAVRSPTGRVVSFQRVYANQMAAEYLRQSTETFTRPATFATLAQQLEVDYQPVALRVLQTGQIHREEVPFVTQTNRHFWFDMTISPTETGVIASFIDITASKSLSATERAQTERLRQIVAHSFNGILVGEAIRDEQDRIVDFRLVLANRAAATMRGRNNVDLTDTLLESLPTLRVLPLPGHPGGQPIFDAYVAVVQTGQPLQYEIEYRHDGLNGWYRVMANKLNDGLVLTFLDTSATRQSQRDLEETVLQLRQTNEHLAQFARIASHDLQEPLRKIQTFGDLLEAQLPQPADPSLLYVVRRMRASAARMQGYVKDLLAFARLTNTTQPFGPVPLTALLTNIVTELPPAEAASVSVGLLPVVVGDGVQLHQLFSSLLNNAFKFGQAGRPVQVQVSARYADRADRPPGLTSRSGRVVAIDVTDNGMGFDEKYLDRIFAIFQRLNRPDEFAGNGMGLAIARKVTDNHQGAISARSHPGVGATFTVWLPM